MSEPLRIVVPFDLARCSPNLRQHWRRKAEVTAAARAAGRAAWVQAGQPRAAGPVRVSLVVRRARRLDQANLWAAAKGCLDGVFVAALTPDDSEDWVRLGGVAQEVSRAYRGREECEFVVEAIR